MYKRKGSNHDTVHKHAYCIKSSSSFVIPAMPLLKYCLVSAWKEYSAFINNNMSLDEIKKAGMWKGDSVYKYVPRVKIQNVPTALVRILVECCSNA